MYGVRVLGGGLHKIYHIGYRCMVLGVCGYGAKVCGEGLHHYRLWVYEC